MSTFRFKQFSVRNERSAMKVNTDGVLLGAWVGLSDEKHILDAGTGTGTIALMLAQRHPGAQISAIDIDEASFLEASENFSASPWSVRLKAFHCPLQEYEPEAAPDLVVSNPPFFDSSLENPDMRKNTARHTSGDNLSYRSLLDFCAEHACRLSLILPADRERDLLRCAASKGFFPTRICRVQTTREKAPSRIMAELSPVAKKDEAPRCESLIMQEKGKHTPEYISLVKDFYLFA